MQLTDQPHIFPAVTLFGNAGGPVVDTGCDLLPGGRVYVDRIEANEIARLFGFTTPEQAESYRRRIGDLEQQLDEALATVARIRELVVAETMLV